MKDNYSSYLGNWRLDSNPLDRAFQTLKQHGPTKAIVRRRKKSKQVPIPGDDEECSPFEERFLSEEYLRETTAVPRRSASLSSAECFSPQVYQNYLLTEAGQQCAYGTNGSCQDQFFGNPQQQNQMQQQQLQQQQVQQQQQMQQQLQQQNHIPPNQMQQQQNHIQQHQNSAFQQTIYHADYEEQTEFHPYPMVSSPPFSPNRSPAIHSQQAPQQCITPQYPQQMQYHENYNYSYDPHVVNRASGQVSETMPPRMSSRDSTAYCDVVGGSYQYNDPRQFSGQHNMHMNQLME